ncbi:LacI family DNA-binding transcriptional regulator [Clostridium boliviensis]|uniref:LacI family DNA-binding transcriptional regulator n=1 Tax=Clostridium boliviensis TaxID=318465 RepID=A0ABU4GQ04_9CLOT|nr:LacI family DNA-binding transcriptional regulator [Clostridium boliviensis]MDW2799716.1 LacI family DNA-binding transcriptional regulator [Clostridium boliviensis]
MEKDREKVSIYRIAEEAGVSPATVSRVLTKNANVSEEKKKKVEKLISKYNFSPNAMARGLTSSRSGIIGVLIPDIRNPFYAGLAVECERAAGERNYSLMLSNYMNDMRLEEQRLYKLVSQQIDALIIMGGRVDERITDSVYAERINRVCDFMPVVTTGKLEGSDCYQVNLDDSAGMDRMMEYLISNGHRKICIIGGRKDVDSTHTKSIRYRSILKKYGITFCPDYIVETGGYSMESGYRGMNYLLENAKWLPSAVIAINDLTALGIIKSLREHSLRIPEDISVVSFDNTLLAETSVPRLTSMDYNYQQYGDTLINTALAVLEDRNPKKIQIIPTELVIRDSCRKLNGDT